VSLHAQIRKGETTRCILVHDHVLLRRGLRRLLDDEADIEVVSEAGSAAEALRVIFEHRPAVVIADVHMFECDPDQAEQMILKESPESKVVFLTAHDDEGEEHRASAHQTGYVVRQTSVPEFLAMVRRAAAAEETPRRKVRRNALTEWPSEDILPRQRILTTRERQVLKLLAEGRTVRLAAETLGLSVKTVDAHKFNLMRKLGIHNKAGLVMWAIQKRVVKLPANF
jgi:two-component system, NarL family, response regulator NreC